MKIPAALSRFEQPLRLFVLAEVLLALAVPLFAYVGYRALLGSRSGVYIEEPVAGEPGWSAIVEPSRVQAWVEVVVGPSGPVTTGVSLLVVDSNTVILIPGVFELAENKLRDLDPEIAAQTVADHFRIAFSDIRIMHDDEWSQVLGDKAYIIDSPDVVVDENQIPLHEVGLVTVRAGEVARFIGLPSAGSKAPSEMIRRTLLWQSLASDPPEHNWPLKNDAVVVGVDHKATDPASIEKLLRAHVPFLAGTDDAPRLQVMIVDRSGRADLELAAEIVAAKGIEVLSVGVAPVIDNKASQLVGAVNPEPFVMQQYVELSKSLLGGASIDMTDEGDALESNAEITNAITDTTGAITLFIGDDFERTIVD